MFRPTNKEIFVFILFGTIRTCHWWFGIVGCRQGYDANWGPKTIPLTLRCRCCSSEDGGHWSQGRYNPPTNQASLLLLLLLVVKWIIRRRRQVNDDGRWQITSNVMVSWITGRKDCLMWRRNNNQRWNELDLGNFNLSRTSVSLIMRMRPNQQYLSRRQRSFTWRDHTVMNRKRSSSPRAFQRASNSVIWRPGSRQKTKTNSWLLPISTIK